MTQMPKRTTQQVSAGQAIREIERALPPAWIVRKEAQELDYGIDLEIEIASETVTGRLFKVQSKGHQRIEWNKSGSYLQPVREETLNYWDAIPLPVVIMVVDHSAGRVYWSPGRRSDEVQGVYVSRSHDLRDSLDQLEAYVIDWLDARGVRAMLYSLPRYDNAWRQLSENTGYDFHMPLSDEDFCGLEQFYRDTELYRDVLGVSGDIFPWQLWIARSRVALGANENLYWGIFDEIIAYLQPFVERIIALGRSRLLAEKPATRNLAALSWANNYLVEHRVRLDFEFAPMDFWARIDAILAGNGALRWPVAARPKKNEDGP